MAYAPSKPLVKRSGFKALLLAVAVAAIEAVASWLGMWDAPEWLAPWIPLVVGVLSLILSHLRSPSVDVRDLPMGVSTNKPRILS